MTDPTEKIQAQRQYLDMLQAVYNHNPILIKIREGGNPDPKNEDVRLYKWMPYGDVWNLVTEPIYTRGIMPNEVFIDPDTTNWWTMQSAITRLLKYCKENNIQYNECAFSGGKGIHVSFLVGQFGIPDDLENRIKSLNVDYMRTVRQSLVKELLNDTDISPDQIGLDWGKINFSKEGKGSQVRCFGTTRKDGSFKTQIEPDKIPVEKPKPGSLPLNIPESIREWNITGTKYHSVVLDALQAECDRVEHANNNPAQDVTVNGDIQNFPCMRYIIANIADMKSGRYEAAKAIVLLCEKLGYSKEETHNSTYQILQDCKHFAPGELETYTHNAMTAYGGYQFSCVKVRDVVGTGGCDKHRCPLSDAYREHKREERIATAEAEREQGYKDIYEAIKNVDIPEKRAQRTQLAIKLFVAYCEPNKPMIEDIIIDEMGERWGFNKTKAAEIATEVVKQHKERKPQEKPEGTTLRHKDVRDQLFEFAPCFVMRDSLEWYEYQKGAYKNMGTRKTALPVRAKIRKIMEDETGVEIDPGRIGNCMSYIEDKHHVEREQVNTNPAEIVIRNGILNVETGDIEPHNPDKLITVRVDVKYDPDADCPHFKGYLDNVLPEVDGYGRTKNQLKNTVFEWIGYNLYQDMPYPKALFQIGEGGNGKGTFQKILNNFLGNDNVSAMSLEQIADTDKFKFRVGGLYGRLANICGDLGNREIKNSEGFKLATGKDMIDADVKNGAPFRFVSHAKLTFSANEIPQTNDNSDGFFDRFVILPFPHKIRGTSRDDPDIWHKCTTDKEKSGILNEALAGLRRVWENNGFKYAGTTSQTRDTWKRGSDPVGYFIEDCLEHREGATTTIDAIYMTYCKYAEKYTLPTIDATQFKNRFGQRLNRKFPHDETQPPIQKKRGYDSATKRNTGTYYANLVIVDPVNAEPSMCEGEDNTDKDYGVIVTDLIGFVNTKHIHQDKPIDIALDFCKVYPTYQHQHGINHVAQIVGKLKKRGWT
jgi:putative DNA primase/helicase